MAEKNLIFYQIEKRISKFEEIALSYCNSTVTTQITFRYLSCILQYTGGAEPLTQLNPNVVLNQI